MKTHPLVATGQRHFAGGLVLGALAVGVAATAMPGALTLSALFAVCSVYFARNGIALKTAGVALPTLQESLSLITRGRFDEAERLPDRLPASVRKRAMVARVITNQRTLIALMRGDAEAAERYATESVALPSQLFTRDWDEVQRCEARAMRALARAGRGDAKAAEEDIAFVETSEHSLPSTLARAALARATVIARSGDKAKLAEELGVHGNLVLEHVMPRERSLVRALRALARAPGKSVYREPAQPDQPEVTEAAKVRAWIESIAPDAAAYAPREAPARAIDQAPPVAEPEAMRAIAAARQTATPANARARRRKTLILWVLLVVLFLAIYQLLDPGAARHATAPPPSSDFPLWLAPLAIAALIGSIAWVHRRYRVQQRRVLRAARDIAVGKTGAARKELVAVASMANYPALAASACATLAALANKQAEFARAIEHCDAGLAMANKSPTSRALSNDQATPQLIAERALALAALDRFAEAEGELSHLVHGFGQYVLLPTALFKVRLVSAVRRGDLAAAAALARSRTPEMPIDLRVDLLADVALVESGDPTSKDDRDRIATELRALPDVNAWVERIVGDRRRAEQPQRREDEAGEERDDEIGAAARHAT